jgi:hypothetical protein
LYRYSITPGGSRGELVALDKCTTVCPREIIDKVPPPAPPKTAAAARAAKFGEDEFAAEAPTVAGFELASPARLLPLAKSRFYPLPVVKFDTGEYLVAAPVEWSYEEPRKVRSTDAHGKVSFKVEKIRLAFRIQVPVTLAWAMTVHSCIGLTLRNVCIDLGSSIFEFAQAYVAMTRVGKLDGLLLSNYVRESIKADPVALNFHDQLARDLKAEAAKLQAESETPQEQEDDQDEDNNNSAIGRASEFNRLVQIIKSLDAGAEDSESE